MQELEIPVDCCCFRHLSAKSANSKNPHYSIHGDGAPHWHSRRYATDTAVQIGPIPT